MLQIWLDRVSRLVTLCSSPQGSENQPQKPLSLLHSPPWCLRCGPNCPPTQCCTLQVAEIRVEMELRDEILPRAQNIQSRLDRQTIETEEVQDGLAQVWGQGPGHTELDGHDLPFPFLLTRPPCSSSLPHFFLPGCHPLPR